MKADLLSQYKIALGMLRGVVGEMSEELWLDREQHRNAAWHIAYHTVYYANYYCSPTEEAVKQWSETKVDYRILGKTPWPPHEEFAPDEPYSRDEIATYIDFVLEVIPGDLDAFEPEKPCWPGWYDQTQYEFQLNSLRHIQHHVGQLTERNGGSSVSWFG
jgi:hypothetical protein